MKQLWEKIVALAGSNFGLKVLALTIAVGLWVAGHRDIERAIEVPVQLDSIVISSSGVSTGPLPR